MPSTGLLPSILLALFAGGALVLGSALPNAPLLRKHLFYHRLSLLIGFSAGLMLATALHDLLPEALENNHDYAMWGAAVGFLTLYFAERMTHGVNVADFIPRQIRGSLERYRCAVATGNVNYLIVF